MQKLIIISLVFISMNTSIFSQNNRSIMVEPCFAVGNGPSGFGLQSFFGFRQEKELSFSIGLGFVNLFKDTSPIPTSGGQPIYNYSSNPTLFEVTNPSQLGVEIDPETFFSGNQRGILHFKPKKDYRIDKYISFLASKKLVKSNKWDLEISGGLGIGLTDDSEIISWYSHSALLSPPEEVIVYYEIARKLRYLHYSVQTNIRAYRKISDNLSLSTTLGFNYFPTNGSFFISDQRLFFLGIGLVNKF